MYVCIYVYMCVCVCVGILCISYTLRIIYTCIHVICVVYVYDVHLRLAILRLRQRVFFVCTLVSQCMSVYNCTMLVSAHEYIYIYIYIYIHVCV
jgi:hypothetical protein